jgi:epoxyqueuosine reductase
MTMNQKEFSLAICQEALNLGFTACGIAPADRLEEDSMHLAEWLSQGMHAGMHYMEKYPVKRIDPRLLLSDAKSVITVILNYYTPLKPEDESNLIISKYAYGQDYHNVLKRKLIDLQKFILIHAPELKSQIAVDTSPVLERAWAARAGLGWIGKNANLISPRFGSFVFIAEIITDLELSYDHPIKDFCGSCTKCLQCCPTGAIVAPRKIDSNRCISYLTIENKGAIPEHLKDNFNNRIFGCDICQDVCPWNRKAETHNTPEFQVQPELIAMTRNDWKNLTVDAYRKLFYKSAVKRAKYEGLKRNIDFVSRVQ